MVIQHSKSHLKKLLLIVSRMPEPGYTKTRLAATQGNGTAALLHRAFLHDLAAKFTPARAQHDGYQLGWAYTPPDAEFGELLQEINPESNLGLICLLPQIGSSLTERLANLADWSKRAGFAYTILMASDSPQLGPEIITETFDKLERSDLVLGRVLDGGYYLVGLTSGGNVLRESRTGSSDAAESLAQAAENLGMRIGELPPTFDIDVEADLEHLCRHLKSRPESAPHTLKTMKELKLLP